MKTILFSFLFSICHVSAAMLASSPLQSQTIIFDFERPKAVPGVVFEPGFGVVVSDSPVPTAPSGTKARATAGGRISFTIPVIRVEMLVSPYSFGFGGGVNGYYTVHLNAYGHDGSLLGTATAPVLFAVAEPEWAQNFRPTQISIGAAVPIAQVTIDLDDGSGLADGGTFLIDDLTLTVQDQQPLMSPTISIHRFADRVRISRAPITADIEQTDQLSNAEWQSLTLPKFNTVELPATNHMLFFRAVRQVR